MPAPISFNQPYRNETIAASVGGTVFVASTLALVILIALQANVGIGGIISLHGVEVSALAIFSVALHLRQRKVIREIESEKNETLQNHADARLVRRQNHVLDPGQIPVAAEQDISQGGPSDEFHPIEEFKSDPEVMSPPLLPFAEYQDLIARNLNDLKISFGNFLVAFAAAYERSEGNVLSKNSARDILEPINDLFTTLDIFFKDTKQLGRLAFQFSFLKFLDGERVETLLKKNNELFFKNLLTAFTSPEIGDESEHLALMFILVDLLKSPNLPAALKKTIDKLRGKSREKAVKLAEQTKAQQAYDAVQDADTREALVNAMAEYQEKEKEYSMLLKELVDQIYNRTDAGNTQIFKEHSEAILSSWFNNFLGYFLSKFTDYSVSLKNGFSPRGILNDEGKIKIVYLATSFYGRRFVYQKMNKKIDAYPIEEKYKEPLKQAFSNIFPPLVNAFYYGLFAQTHPLRKAIEAFVNSAAYRIPEIQEASAQEPFRITLEFLEMMTKRLNDIRFTS